MKSKTLQIKADVGDTVSVPTLELRAVIIGLYFTRFFMGYEIAYFHDGDRKTAYLYDHEFELVVKD